MTQTIGCEGFKVKIEHSKSTPYTTLVFSSFCRWLIYIYIQYIIIYICNYIYVYIYTHPRTYLSPIWHELQLLMTSHLSTRFRPPRSPSPGVAPASPGPETWGRTKLAGLQRVGLGKMKIPFKTIGNTLENHRKIIGTWWHRRLCVSSYDRYHSYFLSCFSHDMATL